MSLNWQGDLTMAEDGWVMEFKRRLVHNGVGRHLRRVRSFDRMCLGAYGVWMQKSERI